MSGLESHIEYNLIRPVREKIPMTEHIPNQWLVLLGGGGITGVLSVLASVDLAGTAAGVLGVGTAFATVIGFLIVKVGQARIQVDRERLAYEKERAVALDGTFAGKLQYVSEQLDEAKVSAHAQKELNATLQETINDMRARVEAANRKLHDLANEANEVRLQHMEEVAKHTEETVVLRQELAKVNGQLVQANLQLTALREENERLNNLVRVTAKKTVENKAAIEATNARVERMQQDSGSVPTVPGSVADEPTVDAAVIPSPSQPKKAL